VNRGVIGLPGGGVRCRVVDSIPAPYGDGDMILVRTGGLSIAQGTFANIAGKLPVYDHIALIYDAAYGRWVSLTPELVIAQDDNDWALGGSNAAYSEIAVTGKINPRHAMLPFAGRLWKAGVRPQVKIGAWGSASGAGGYTYDFRAALIYVASGVGNPAAPSAFSPDGTLSIASITPTGWMVSDWADFTGPMPTDDLPHMTMRAEWKTPVTFSTAGVIRALQYWIRWVSAP
jgi:hypothetical protein